MAMLTDKDLTQNLNRLNCQYIDNAYYLKHKKQKGGMKWLKKCKAVSNRMQGFINLNYERRM
ncbi:MAG: hypothetical protein A2Z50_00855 [Nitrospirae bacterium RBG_19FT_COMBO_42_15]|nr:MAG: hypothetical protein A2Z50_00855 [Nitrospirae bacterium RBG_19FT_COMBO_42_15]